MEAKNALTEKVFEVAKLYLGLSESNDSTELTTLCNDISTIITTCKNHNWDKYVALKCSLGDKRFVEVIILAKKVLDALREQNHGKA